MERNNSDDLRILFSIQLRLGKRRKNAERLSQRVLYHQVRLARFTALSPSFSQLRKTQVERTLWPGPPSSKITDYYFPSLVSRTWSLHLAPPIATLPRSQPFYYHSSSFLLKKHPLFRFRWFNFRCFSTDLRYPRTKHSFWSEKGRGTGVWESKFQLELRLCSLLPRLLDDLKIETYHERNSRFMNIWRSLVTETAKAFRGRVDYLILFFFYPNRGSSSVRSCVYLSILGKLGAPRVNLRRVGYFTSLFSFLFKQILLGETARVRAREILIAYSR